MTVPSMRDSELQLEEIDHIGTISQRCNGRATHTRERTRLESKVNIMQTVTVKDCHRTKAGRRLDVWGGILGSLGSGKYGDTNRPRA